MRSASALRALVLAVVVLAAASVSVAVAATPTTPTTPAAAARRPVKKQVLPWIEDDWTRAVALAKARKLPIFVDSWAPW